MIERGTTLLAATAAVWKRLPTHDPINHQRQEAQRKDDDHDIRPMIRFRAGRTDHRHQHKSYEGDVGNPRVHRANDGCPARISTATVWLGINRFVRHERLRSLPARRLAAPQDTATGVVVTTAGIPNC